MTYNGETESSGEFLLPKFLDYIEQKDSHASTLTVAETMEFAWKSTTGGHHSYGVKKNEEAGNLLDEGDEILRKVMFVHPSPSFVPFLSVILSSRVILCLPPRPHMFTLPVCLHEDE